MEPNPKPPKTFLQQLIIRLFLSAGLLLGGALLSSLLLVITSLLLVAGGLLVLFAPMYKLDVTLIRKQEPPQPESPMEQRP